MAHIRCPPDGAEDDVVLRLRDAASYRIWVTVECDHVQQGGCSGTCRGCRPAVTWRPVADARTRECQGTAWRFMSSCEGRTRAQGC